jgi:hypothetical protein
MLKQLRRYIFLYCFYYIMSFIITETLTISTPHRKYQYVASFNATVLVLQTQDSYFWREIAMDITKQTIGE